MTLNIGRNEKGKLVCWVPTIKKGVERLDGILVSDLVLTVPQSPLHLLQPVFGQECPQFELTCEVTAEEVAAIEKMKLLFAEKYQ